MAGRTSPGARAAAPGRSGELAGQLGKPSARLQPRRSSCSELLDGCRRLSIRWQGGSASFSSASSAAPAKQLGRWHRSGRAGVEIAAAESLDMTSGPAVWHCIFLYVGRATSAVRVAGVYGLTRVLLHGAACQEMLFDRRELQALMALSEPARLVNTVHGRTRNTVYPTACSDGHTRTTPTQLILYGIATTRPHLRCHCYRTRALDRGTAHLPSGCPSGHPPAAS